MGDLMTNLEKSCFAGIDPDRLYKTCELAALTNFTPEFFEAMRYRGEGPAWITVNRRSVRYLGKTVIDWLHAGLQRPTGRNVTDMPSQTGREGGTNA